jgi:hypothetical protein
MDSTCWKILGIAGSVVAALVAAIKILWDKVAEERQETDKAKSEILELHKRRIAELEEFKRMVEAKGKK